MLNKLTAVMQKNGKCMIIKYQNVTPEPEKTSVASQYHGKHVSVATNTHATIEEPQEAVFYTHSVLRLYNQDKWDKLVSCESAVIVGGWLKQRNLQCQKPLPSNKW
jgi:hypothetical protein